jgi:hypothetical protein
MHSLSCTCLDALSCCSLNSRPPDGHKSIPVSTRQNTSTAARDFIGFCNSEFHVVHNGTLQLLSPTLYSHQAGNHIAREQHIALHHRRCSIRLVVLFTQCVFHRSILALGPNEEKTNIFTNTRPLRPTFILVHPYLRALVRRLRVWTTVCGTWEATRRFFSA